MTTIKSMRGKEIDMEKLNLKNDCQNLGSSVNNLI